MLGWGLLPVLPHGSRGRCPQRAAGSPQLLCCCRIQAHTVCSVLQDAKKKYDKETEKYCGVLEKHLNLSSKKKESQLQEVRATSSFQCLAVTVLSFLNTSCIF